MSDGAFAGARARDHWHDASVAQIGPEQLDSERLKARLGDMLLKTELLEAKIAVLEGGRPLARRRLRP